MQPIFKRRTPSPMSKKNIYVLLMRMPDSISKALSLWMRFHYTHVSIGLEEDLEHFYSFGYSGFRVESVERFNRSAKGPFPCALYEIPVSEKTYDRVKKQLMSFVEKKEQLHFTLFGVALSLCKIRHKFEDHYFCSQFVSEVLHDCEVLPQHKHSSLFMPCDFSKQKELRLVFQGMLTGLPAIAATLVEASELISTLPL